MPQNVVVTGGAGFIGSNFVRFLNENGIKPIIVEDMADLNLKWKNLNGLEYIDLLDYRDFLTSRYIRDFQHSFRLVHLGAKVDTTEEFNLDLWQTNVEFSLKLIRDFAFEKVVYASSAAVYGNTTNFAERFDCAPVNPYAFTKLTLDKNIFVYGNYKNVCGLRFFNVYGLNESHKGSMASFVHKCLNKKQVTIYKYNPQPKRDFVYVGDVCKVICYLLENKACGIFNVGSGFAETFEHVALTANCDMDIVYEDMPEKIRNGYQYYSCADLSNLRLTGYHDKFLSLQEGVKKMKELKKMKEFPCVPSKNP